jgi:hypothetical protein
VLFSEPVLAIIRRELNRDAEARLEMSDVFSAVKDLLSKDALLAAGDISLPRRRRRRKVKRTDASGQVQEVEVEGDDVVEGEGQDGQAQAPATPQA